MLTSRPGGFDGSSEGVDSDAETSSRTPFSRNTGAQNREDSEGRSQYGQKIIARGELVRPGAIEPNWSKKIDWEKVRLEVSRGVQLNILAREHAEGTISYVQFWRQFHKKYPEVEALATKSDPRQIVETFLAGRNANTRQAYQSDLAHFATHLGSATLI
ncbi:unnamed protein product [Sphagnum jensenii]